MRGEKPVKYSLAGLFVLFLIFFVWILLKNVYNTSPEIVSFSGVVKEVDGEKIVVKKVDENVLKKGVVSGVLSIGEKFLENPVFVLITSETKFRTIGQSDIKPGMSLFIEGERVKDASEKYKAMVVGHMPIEDWIRVSSDVSFFATVVSIDGSNVFLAFGEEEKNRVKEPLVFNEEKKVMRRPLNFNAEGNISLLVSQKPILLNTVQEIVVGKKLLFGLKYKKSVDEYEILAAWDTMKQVQ